jgi:hypothetical protein
MSRMVDRSRAACLSAILAVLAGTSAFGCAAPGGGANRQGQVRGAPAEYSRPEPDPACRSTVQAPLAANGLEQVTVKIAVDRTGKPTLIEFLSPELTPAVALELRRAFEQCIWKPALGPDGQPRAGLTTIFVRSGD